MTEWHKYPDTKPEYNKLVLVIGIQEPAVAKLINGSPYGDYFMTSNKNYYSEDIDGVTLWAELPEAPHD